MKRNTHSRAWMLLLSLILLGSGGGCLWMLRLSTQYNLPAKAETVDSISTQPAMNRDHFEWIPPEPEEIIELEPTYDMTIDLANVQSYHMSVSDVVGWIRVPDTVINYPVMQTTNNSYYTDHTWQGQYSHNGAIFADWRCTLEGSDNATLYGHNLASGTMFHAIKNYKDREWGNAHPYIEVASLEHRYLYKVLSVNVLYGETGTEFEYWNYYDMNRTDYREFYEGIRESALVWYGDDTPPRDKQDRLIALQTCNSGASDGMRCVVFAELIGDFTDVSHYDPNEETPEARMELQ